MAINAGHSYVVYEVATMKVVATAAYYSAYIDGMVYGPANKDRKLAWINKTHPIYKGLAGRLIYP